MEEGGGGGGGGGGAAVRWRSSGRCSPCCPWSSSSSPSPSQAGCVLRSLHELVSCQVIREYERAVIFRLGRAVEGRAKGPGLFWFIPWLDVIQKVDLRTVSFNIHPQEVLTADGVSLKVDAVVFYRVVDPSSWVTRVENGYEAIHTLAQTTLRAALGAHTLTDVLTQRTGVVRRMEEALYAASTLWGVQVERVEIKDLSLPVDLQRCMASEAEAARRARAKMIMAEGEVKASHALKEAASGLSPVAYHLRYLQSLSSVQSSASIVVFSLPAELLNMFISHQPQDVSAGYDISRWRETLLQLGQTKAFFSTTATLPYRKLSYRVDMVTWNQYLRWGVVYIRLHSGRNFTEARIDHKLLRFEQYTSTRLLAQFDDDLQQVQKISLRINTGNVIGPRYKIRLLRIRFTPLERPERPLICRFDIIMEENMEVAFRPLPCDSRL